MQSFRTFLPAFLVPCQSPILRFFEDSAVCNLLHSYARNQAISQKCSLLAVPYTSKALRLLPAHTHTAAPSLGSEACLQINFPQNGSLFAYCHSRFVYGIESTLHVFFPVFPFTFFVSCFFRESESILSVDCEFCCRVPIMDLVR